MRFASSLAVGISAIRKFLAPLLVTSELSAAAAARPRTFGKGIPNHPFTDAEVDLFNHSLPPTSTVGMVTHFWSTACGAGVSFKGGLDSGVAIYRYYIDGEEEASVVFSPRDVAGVVFDPVGECSPPTCTHRAPGGQGGGGGRSKPDDSAPRRDEYLIGGRGQTCTEACVANQRICNPVLNPNGTNPEDLGRI